MTEFGGLIVENAGYLWPLYARRHVEDSTADCKVQASFGREQRHQRNEMLFAPYIIVTNVGDVCALRQFDPRVIG